MGIINVQHLSFRYKNASQNALTDINFSVDEGKLTAVLGPTNAGKSTLCLSLNGVVPHMISGTMKGELSVCGVRTSEVNAETVAQLTRHIGAVFQNPESQLFGLSVEEDIAFGPENLRVPPAEITGVIDEMLKLVGLSEFRRRSPYLLSGGQKQRVAIASAMAMHPEVIVLDEPVSELDPVGKNEVLQIVQRLNAEGKVTIVIADHDPEQTLSLAQQILILDKGRLLAKGDPYDVFQDIDRLRKTGLKIPAASEITNWMVEAGLSSHIEISEESAINSLQDLIQKGFLSLTTVKSKRNTQAEPQGRQPVIEIQRVSFHYPEGQNVLCDISLDIYENDYIGLVGSNGSGKTTLAKHFNHILEATEGKVLLNGKNMHGMRISDAARQVGYVYQNPDHQIFARTVFDEVAFGPRNLGYSGVELNHIVEEALAFVGLTGQEAVEPFFLGLGQRQRLAVASVLAMRPEILVVDEPDTGQDKAGAEEMMRLIDRLHAAGKTIIIISHNMELIAEHVHRVIAMSGGRIKMDADTRSFFSDSNVLQQISLRPPQVTRICSALHSPETILTLSEARSSLQVERSNLEAPCP
ncbi:MAG: ATP-binding cassette domain-containing protein [Anaerolineaceae bacterium]|nr:ATP-binding cassette domain-containing protein [Anaerolineaceae bacterium]